MARFNVIKTATGEELASGYKVRGAAQRRANRYAAGEAHVVEAEDLGGWVPESDPNAWMARDAALIEAARARRPA